MNRRVILPAVILRHSEHHPALLDILCQSAEQNSSSVRMSIGFSPCPGQVVIPVSAGLRRVFNVRRLEMARMPLFAMSLAKEVLHLALDPA